MKKLSTDIRLSLAAGSAAPPYYYNMMIKQDLCQSSCADEKPSFIPTLLLKSIEQVGVSQWELIFHLEGTVHYIPCGCNACGTKAQLISKDVAFPVFSTTPITSATALPGIPYNYIEKVACCDCSNKFRCDVPVTLAIVTA